MYAIFRSPLRRTDNTAPSVHFAQTCEKCKKPLAIPFAVCYHLIVDRENRIGQRAARVHAWEDSRAGKSKGSFRAVYLVN